MISQPGVYWHFDAPFVDIVALYSNIAEGPGFIGGTDDRRSANEVARAGAEDDQDRASSNRKALVIAVHHPPFSNGSHASSAPNADRHRCGVCGGEIQPDLCWPRTLTIMSGTPDLFRAPG